MSEVRRTYLEELRRLHSLARIRSFISILAFNSTRSLLREKLRSRA